MSKGSDSVTTTQKQEIDPRLAEYLFGGGRRLKSGVNPIYETTQGAAPQPSPYLDGGQMMPTAPTQRMINPESDYETDRGIFGTARDLYNANPSGMNDLQRDTHQRMQNFINSEQFMRPSQELSALGAGLLAPRKAIQDPYNPYSGNAGLLGMFRFGG